MALVTPVNREELTHAEPGGQPSHIFSGLNRLTWCWLAPQHVEMTGHLAAMAKLAARSWSSRQKSAGTPVALFTARDMEITTNDHISEEESNDLPHWIFHPCVRSSQGDRPPVRGYLRTWRGHHIVERIYGSFVRSFQLPQGLDETNIEAVYNDGILSIDIPKTALPQPRKIEIGWKTQNQMSSSGSTAQKQMRQGEASTERNDDGVRGSRATVNANRQPARATS